MTRFWLALATLIVVGTHDCLGQQPTGVSTEYKVEAVKAWVLHGPSKPETGTVNGSVARIMGLGNSATLNVLTIAAANKDGSIHLWFATVPDRSEIVLVRQDPKIDRMIYWLVANGALSTTVLRQGEKIEVVSGENYQDDGKAILNIFYGKILERQKK